ncbi:MAG: O-antigen ligase family protein [Candidatus Omnitrophota bacterium]
MIDRFLKKISMKEVINYLAIFIIFAGAWMYNIGSFHMVRGYFILMFAVLILWMPFLKRLYFNKPFLILFSIIVFLSFLNIILGNNTVTLLMKQTVGIILSAFIFYILIRINEYDMKKLFNIYLNIAFIVALVGIFQGVSFLIGFKPGYDYSWFLSHWRVNPNPQLGGIRISSILVEPSQFCNVMIPAIFVSITSLFNIGYKFIGKRKAIIFILPFLFTFSSMGFLSILVVFILLGYNYFNIKNMIMAGAAVLACLCLFYFSVDAFRTRLDDSIRLVKGEVAPEITNLSTFALYSNARVAFSSFINNPFFGAGLGSHEENYYKYIGEVVNVDKVKDFVNVKDSGSLFLRLLSETGFLGVLVIFIFVFKFYLKRRSDPTEYLWMINNAVATIFFMRLVRNGHYFNEGFFFFIWMYYFSKKKAIRESAEIKSVESL